jgi:putative multiple sugar transport system ATP-binding protein
MTELLQMRGITKTFPGVRALDDVNLTVRAGEIHALCGENGAGKSTLMKILSGVYPHGSYDGEILWRGEPARFRSINDSEAAGIVIIHQELALAPLLSIAENIFLGNERASLGVIDWAETFSRTRVLLDKVGLRLNPATLVEKLGVGQQQLVEIAKALSKKVELLILDEPTSSLNERDSAALLELLLQFKAQGIASILISHKLNEISRVADRITILRDGAAVSTLDCRAGPVGEDRVIRDMVGRPMHDRYPARTPNIGEPIFEIRDWRVHHPDRPDRVHIDRAALTVRRGEIVGIAGLMGAGRTELAMSIFGRSWGARISGTALVEGRPADLSTVGRAMDAGLAYVTEDRKTLGLILDEPIKRNVTLASLPKISRGGVLDHARETLTAQANRAALNVKCSGVMQQVVNLSGGNQQKVVLAKWLNTDPKLLILDEPTRGIDVGAKYEIYAIMNRLAAEGRGVLMISSEMPELLGMCDRIYVMNEGRIVGELPARDASQEAIMRMIIRSAGVAA